MNLNSLPKDMQDDIRKLYSKHKLDIDRVQIYYMMGGYDHADYLCTLADAGLPDSFIRIQSHAIWEEKNKKLWEELKSFNL